MKPAVNTESPLLAFQRYQLDFASHIRDPQNQPKPSKVDPRRMRVYNEIVFNNLYGSVSACFPVAQKVLGKRAWRKLIRDFFANHRAMTPIFREIPEEFLRYLETRHDLPPYIYSLAHYEWVELALSVADVDVDRERVDSDGDILEGCPVLPAALALLSYPYPVHLISPRLKPKVPLSDLVHLLVFRDMQDEVRFIELNRVTARLMVILQAGNMTGREALKSLAAELQEADVETFIGFGGTVLAELQVQGAILGTARD